MEQHDGTISIEWLAGFYEGEGTPTTANYGFGLSISQCNHNVIVRVAKTFGGTAKPTSCHEGEYRWRLYGKKAAVLALELLKSMHHPKKIEQLTKALILTTHLPPRSEDEAIEVEEYREKARAYQRKQHKEYYHRKREEVKVSHQRNHLEHREERLAKMKEWHDSHREEIREYNAQYREKQRVLATAAKLLKEV